MDSEKQPYSKAEDSSLKSSDSPEKNEYYNEELEDPRTKTLHRGLKARQVSMIALGGAVGTGLIIGSGTALQRGGPLGLLLGYAFMGFVCYLVMVALGEMAAFLPHKKGFAGYATRFVDPAMGFALGWNYLMKYLIVTPNNINAAGVVVQYWTQSVHIAVWMVSMNPFAIFFWKLKRAPVFLVNLLGVRVFGELEFWFSSIKVIALIGLILMGIIIDLGGNPKHDRIGFRYWNPPDGPMGKYLLDQVHDLPLARFLGFWAVMTNALFAFMGTELIGVTVGEAENPRRNIPRAIRQTFFRILVFYVGGVFVIGLIVPSTDSSLFVATKAKTGAAASPFVVATTLVGIRTLNHIINAAILLFVMSAANSDLYIGSRTLYGLAVEGKAPRIFKRVNRLGVPYPALIFCTMFCFLVFLNVKSSGAKVFTWFVNLPCRRTYEVNLGVRNVPGEPTAQGGFLFGHLVAAGSNLDLGADAVSFTRSPNSAQLLGCASVTAISLKVQGRSRDDLPYKAPFQPWGSWFALIATGIVLFFKGFDAFMPWKVDSFITSYIAIPVFIVLYVGYKLLYKTKPFAAEEVDLVTGLKEIDDEEQRFKAQHKAEMEQKGPRNRLQRIWDNI
ncbi:amino acid transporter [Marasmius crinis-equi]|uniref:Amino acid transporter n=1 Tax=Marasmius crinis-equi TaxID=585013 RepID=A0ABR3FXK4_9AGAR